MFRSTLSKVLVLIPLLSLGYAAKAHAWEHWDHGWDHDHWHNHGYYHHGYYPSSYINLRFGGEPYYYYNGYYTAVDTDYTVVSPAVGSVVVGIPNSYHQVVIDNRIYYVHDGVYYRRIARGYEVVEPPVAVATPVIVQPQETLVTQAPSSSPSTGTYVNAPTLSSNPDQNEYVVNIPNAQGGYTAVKIKKGKDGSKEGYIGPQGEFYSEFPKVDQLKAMYGK